MSPRPVLAATFVLVAGFAVARTAPEDPRVRAAQAFLESLEETARDGATFEFADEERLAWHFLPNRYPGLLLADLDQEQHERLQGLLGAFLSSAGLDRVAGIRKLEEVLHALESRPDKPATHRDPNRYSIAVFGVPGESRWGWRLQGHHLSLNFTVSRRGEVSHAPFFLGTAPRVVADGEHAGLEVLAAEEASARALLASLTGERRGMALVAGDLPRDVLMAPGKDEAPEAGGLAGAHMSDEQKQLLALLLGRFADLLSDDIVTGLRSSDLNELRFLWMGSTEPGEAHYWRVQSPHFVLEWDTPAGQAHHVHCVLRAVHGEFGRLLLRDEKK